MNKVIQRDLSLDRNNIPKNIIVASTFGGGSHLVPMLEICKILMDRGYNVTLVAPGNFTAKSELYNSIPQINMGEEIDLYHKFPLLENYIFEQKHFNVFHALRSFSSSKYVNTYNTFKKVAEEINVDLFICDFFLNHACYDIAWKLKKPAVGITSVMNFVVDTPPYRSDPVFGCNVYMEYESLYSRLRCLILEPLKFLHAIISIESELNVQRAKVGVEPFWNPNGRILNNLMLYDNFFGFEMPMSLPPLHQEIGPILPDTFPSLTPSPESFLAEHPRTIYFALGTIGRIPPQNTITLLKSFNELINQNIIDGVIWAFTKTNISNLFSINDNNFKISIILNNEHPHIHTVKYAPQFAILSHENTKLFLSHGGAASSHESIYTATPMLILPMLGDQLGNAEKLEIYGMALKFMNNNLEINDVVSKVKRLINEESFKKNAERLQFLAKVNSKRKHRGADLIEVVMNTIRSEGIKDENGSLMIDNNVLLKEWISPGSRMGFIRGSYLDVYTVAVITFLTLSSGFGYLLWKIIKFSYNSRNGSSRESSKPKSE
ncbi:Glycosyltransferase Family 1 protein [Gigaspora rosea]|uniref:Glycosyltransferase Family 1 protein n=1 Tax=Gigaspora rosea TaxID=44941 RepID=A0A397VJ27_9GLOM|nr:Glycosyltransferase Family 1 protein [Gigaspora rosea]